MGVNFGNSAKENLNLIQSRSLIPQKRVLLAYQNPLKREFIAKHKSSRSSTKMLQLTGAILPRLKQYSAFASLTK